MGEREIKTRLDEVISDVAYILDSLRALQDIHELGRECNRCGRKECEYIPNPGEQVRFNCPLWQDAQEDE